MLLHDYYIYANLAGCSGVGYQPSVVLPTVQRQVAGVRAVIAHMAERNSTRGEACSRLVVARTLIPVVADVNERQLLEAHVWC